jgi:hypothetical protein
MRPLIRLFFLVCFTATLFAQENSVQLREGGNLLASYNSIQAAYNAIPAGVTQPYLIEILTDYTGANEIFPIELTSRTGTSALNSIIIRPAAGNNNEVITMSASTPMLNFRGCSYVILDGRPGGVGDTASLQLRNNATAGSSNTVQFIDAATNNILRYVHSFNGSAGTAGGRNIGISTTSLGPNVDNIISHCLIEGGRTGVHFGTTGTGTAGIFSTGTVVQFSTIKNFGYAGVWMVGGASGTTISTNSIFQETASSSTIQGGISIAAAGGGGVNTFENNKIYGIFSTSASDKQIRGITLTAGAAGATYNIRNNFISLNSDGGGSWYGVLIAGSNDFNANVVYNSVFIGGNHTGGTAGTIYSIGIYKSSTSDTGLYVQKNNVVLNTRGGGTAGVFHLGGFIPTAALAGNLEVDYNTYRATGQTTQYHAGWSGFVYGSEAQYRDSAAPHEANSNFYQVEFTSQSDLHLAGGSIGNVLLTGTPIPGITTDIDFQTRSTTHPYRGADEANVPIPVELSAFTASVQGTTVTLAWTTSTETNNYGFEIERSSGESGWVNTGFVAGKGTTTEINYYSFSDENLAAGSYNYRIRQIDLDGSYTYYNLTESVQVGVPAEYSLSQNYPNPFNPTTTIKYALAKDSDVKVIIYNALGKEVTQLVNSKQEAGYYEIKFAAEGLASGVYFYSIKAGDFVSTKKMILLK